MVHKLSRFCSVVVITCASHAQGPRFEPEQKQFLFLNPSTLLLQAVLQAVYLGRQAAMPRNQETQLRKSTTLAGLEPAIP